MEEEKNSREIKSDCGQAEIIDESETDAPPPNASYSHQDEYFLGDVYNPQKEEDSARRQIAFALIGLLWVLVTGVFVLLWFGKITAEAIKDFGVILSPVIALVSAATGFYYGKNSNSTSN